VTNDTFPLPSYKTYKSGFPERKQRETEKKQKDTKNGFYNNNNNNIHHPPFIYIMDPAWYDMQSYRMATKILSLAEHPNDEQEQKLIEMLLATDVMVGKKKISLCQQQPMADYVGCGDNACVLSIDLWKNAMLADALRIPSIPSSWWLLDSAHLRQFVALKITNIALCTSGTDLLDPPAYQTPAAMRLAKPSSSPLQVICDSMRSLRQQKNGKPLFLCRYGQMVEVFVQSLVTKLLMDGVTPHVPLHVASIFCYTGDKITSLNALPFRGFMYQQRYGLMDRPYDGHLHSYVHLPELLHVLLSQTHASALSSTSYSYLADVLFWPGPHVPLLESSEWLNLLHRRDRTAKELADLQYEDFTHLTYNPHSAMLSKRLIHRVSVEMMISVLHTLQILQDAYGLQHNDVKANNIMFQLVKGSLFTLADLEKEDLSAPPAFFAYQVDAQQDHWFYLPNRGLLVKLIDYGMSVAYAVGKQRASIQPHMLWGERFKYVDEQQQQHVQAYKKEYNYIVRSLQFGISGRFQPGYDAHFFIIQLMEQLKWWRIHSKTPNEENIVVDACPVRHLQEHFRLYQAKQGDKTDSLRRPPLRGVSAYSPGHLLAYLFSLTQQKTRSAVGDWLLPYTIKPPIPEDRFCRVPMYSSIVKTTIRSL
jgi:hypothetical protein